MKVLFICDYFPPFAPGGAEWSSYYSAQALTAKGEEVFVLTPNYRKSPRIENKKGIKIIRFPFPFKLKSHNDTLSYFLNSQPLYYLYFAFWIIFYSLKEKTDILHLQSRFSLPGAVLAKLVLKKPLVFTLRNFVLFCPTGTCLLNQKTKKAYSQFNHFWHQCVPQYVDFYLNPKSKLKYFYSRLSLFYAWIDNLAKRRLLKHCDKLIAISKSLKDIYVKANLINKEKVEVIYNLPPLRVKKADRREIDRIKKQYHLKNKKVVLFVGRLTLGKGVYDLLKAGEIIFKEKKDVLFLLIGKGSLRVKLKSWFKVIPAICHEDIFKFYQIADVVVVPTKGIEPFGRVPIEVAFFKKPVVATKSGGLKEQIINNKTGYFVSRGKPEDLAKIILKLLQDKSLRLKIGEKHGQFINKNFNKRTIIKKTLFLYKSLIN